MRQYLDLLEDVIQHGGKRETRTGNTIGVFGRDIQFDLRDGFPAVTTKKLAWKACVGELLWFLNGETNLKDLRKRTCLDDGAWTIWTEDAKRWNAAQWNDVDPSYFEDTGKLYGYQWRSAGGYVDQLWELVERLKTDPMSRYHLMCSWSVTDVAKEDMALPPCHSMVQFYVDGPFLDCIWYQRSVDAFLGAPFNFASYGLLLSIISKLTGKLPRFLKGCLADTHIYENHRDAVLTQLARTPRSLPMVSFPALNTLRDLRTLTAESFVLLDYEHEPAIKAPLSVGS